MAEGVRLLDEALRHKVLPVKLYFDSSNLSQRGMNLIERYKAHGVSTLSCGKRGLARIGAVETSQGILALFKTPSVDLAELYHDRLRTILLCENISDPGNMGTLLRSALAFGFDMAILCGNCTEPFSPKVVRSSAGAVFGLPLAVADTDKAIELADRRRISIIATDSKGRDRMTSVLPRLRRKKVVLALGSEADGLSTDIIDRAESIVRILHTRQVESLNAAVAGSILMRECFESRHRSK